MTSRPLDDVLAEMSLDEKASLTQGSDHWWTTAVERLAVRRVMLSDGPHGLRTQLAESDHVGFAASVPATCFPTSGALASSWNVDLFGEVGRAIAREARKWSVGVVLGPGINMKRSPLCGRNFEYLSEDPWLAGELGAAMVVGIQELGVGASLKHFAANNQETDRLRVSADVDIRTLREIYLPAFERVVKDAKPWTVMSAYNRINGIYASENNWLLTTVLREEWGFDGVVISDWGAVEDRIASLRAGLDLQMPPDHERGSSPVVDAVRVGVLDERVLDSAARRLIRLAERAGPGMAEPLEFDVQSHHELARKAARESAVLLKNDGVLPLHPRAGESIAIIGEFARSPRFQGAGSSRVNATIVSVALEEIVALLPAGVTTTFAPGFRLDGATTGSAGELIAEAVDVARAADHVVVFLGLPASAESEGFDRTHMNLPADQLELLAAVTEVATRVSVVLTNGSSVTVSEWADGVSAILETWLSGQAAGGAIADLLLGVANPSGKLAETIPVRLEDIPSTLNFPGDEGHVRYGEGLFIGYRAHDRLHQAVSYPFGFGLSYTRFALSASTVDVTGSVADGDLAARITVRVENVGEVSGAEVVQVYVADPESSVTRPVRELKAAAKVFLEPGEARTLELELDQRAFSFWSEHHHRWVVEAGDFEIAVGTSSRDLVASHRVVVAAPSLASPVTAVSTLEEWFADPAAKAALANAFDEAGELPLFLNPDIYPVISNMPMRRVAASDSSGLSHETLDAMLVEIESAHARDVQ